MTLFRGTNVVHTNDSSSGTAVLFTIITEQYLLVFSRVCCPFLIVAFICKQPFVECRRHYLLHVIVLLKVGARNKYWVEIIKIHFAESLFFSLYLSR